MNHTPLLGLSTRLPPANLQAEQALLGAILANNKAFERVSGFLSPDHFADPVNGRIFQVVAGRIARGELADAVTLKTILENDGTLADVGGTAYLAQLLTAMVGIINAGEYGQAVHDAWKRRNLIDIGERIVNAAHGPASLESLDPILAAGTADDIVSASVAAIEGAFAAEQQRKGVSLTDALDAAIQAGEDAKQRGGPVGLSTGFPSLDAILGGMEDGTMNVFAGRPGMGKSALVWKMALHSAAQGIGVAGISLEMSAMQLGRRALSVEAGVPLTIMRTGQWSERQAVSIVQARRRMAGLPLTIEDSSGLTVQEIDVRIRAAHRKHGVGLIVVDHLHIVRPDAADERNGGTWAVGKISRAMKTLAKRHSCPVILAAQLNRGVEGRDDKRPTLADLRQAGDIEQDADSVGFVYREEYYAREPVAKEGENPEKHVERLAEYERHRRAIAGKAEVIFAKVRDGEPGTATLQWRGETTSFHEVEHE